MSTELSSPKDTTLKGLLSQENIKEQIAKALPKHLSTDRFLRVAMTSLLRTPKLAECDKASFMQSLLTLSSYGLEPDGRRAHLIPFNNNKLGIVECQLIIDYKGLAELAMRSGIVANIHADVVCMNDLFTYDKGQVSEHKIDFKKDRGAVYAAYATCRFKDGTEKSEVMNREEIEAIRKRSRSGNNGPWMTDWNEMSKKTVFRRLSKWLPLSAEFREAVDTEDDAQFDGIRDVTPTKSAPVPVLKAINAPEVVIQETQIAATVTADIEWDGDGQGLESEEMKGGK